MDVQLENLAKNKVRLSIKDGYFSDNAIVIQSCESKTLEKMIKNLLNKLSVFGKQMPMYSLCCILKNSQSISHASMLQ